MGKDQVLLFQWAKNQDGNLKLEIDSNALPKTCNNWQGWVMVEKVRNKEGDLPYDEEIPMKTPPTRSSIPGTPPNMPMQPPQGFQHSPNVNIMQATSPARQIHIPTTPLSGCSTPMSEIYDATGAAYPLPSISPVGPYVTIAPILQGQNMTPLQESQLRAQLQQTLNLQHPQPVVVTTMAPPAAAAPATAVPVAQQPVAVTTAATTNTEEQVPAKDKTQTDSSSPCVAEEELD